MLEAVDIDWSMDFEEFGVQGYGAKSWEICLSGRRGTWERTQGFR